MNPRPIFAPFLVALFASTTLGCGDETTPEESKSVAWDESSQGELSGDLSAPTTVTLKVGDNLIVGTSVPGMTETCIENPDGSKAPYYPESTTYTDAFTFTLPADHKLVNIHVEKLDVEAVHSACGLPIDMQLGAFTALAKSDKIDWSSDTFENFVKLPVENPLIGAAFAKSVNDDLLEKYKGGFSFGPYMIDALAADPTDGTYTFWWKEGANKVSYQLNFVVAQ